MKSLCYRSVELIFIDFEGLVNRTHEAVEWIPTAPGTEAQAVFHCLFVGSRPLQLAFFLIDGDEIRKCLERCQGRPSPSPAKRMFFNSSANEPLNPGTDIFPRFFLF